jgi:hypothetical protein
MRLGEEGRTSRRTVADALEVVRRVVGLDEVPRAQLRIGLLRLPSGKRTALVNAIFPDLGCVVSLATSARFRGRTGSSSRHMELEISLLDGAEVCSDSSILLVDGTRLRAVEVVPTRLPYKPSKLDEQVLRHVISLTKADNCYRSIREGLPENLQDEVPDLRALDYSRVRTIQAPLLKVIRAFIEDHDPGLQVSTQKIADALATYGIRVPRPRQRAVSQRPAARATI